MHLLPVGRDAFLVDVADAHEAVSLATWARVRLDVGEIVPAARTVLFDGLDRLDGDLAVLLADWRPEAVEPGPLVDLEVVWNGPDLAFVTRQWGREVAEVMTAIEFTVGFSGFAPGFAYLTGLPSGLAVPRLDTPRSAVPPGSVALAGEYAGIYPTASPGGWRLVGHTDATLWDPTSSSPALLAPGTRVRFT